jgi:hypothetical protein
MTTTQGSKPNSASDAAVKRMKSVKATCDQTSDGDKKASALKHFQAAEKAHTARDDANCIKHCKAADQALA